MEISHPGLGIPGTIALLCLFFIILSYLSLQIATWLEVILLLTGLAILLVEIFVLPTFGLLGFFGLIFFLAGLFGILLPGLENFSFDQDTNTFNAAAEQILNRLGWISGAIILAFIIILLLAKYVAPKVGAWSKLILKGNEQEGYKASSYETQAIGMTGVVMADLKPGGYILIDGKKQQAISIDGYLPQGTEVTVIGGNEESLIVRKSKETV